MKIILNVYQYVQKKKIILEKIENAKKIVKKKMVLIIMK